MEIQDRLATDTKRSGGPLLSAAAAASPPPNLSRIGLLALHVSRISLQLGPAASITQIVHPRLSNLLATEVEYPEPKIQIYTGQDPIQQRHILLARERRALVCQDGEHYG